MEIVVVCDQTTCTFNNKGNANNVSHNICTHPHPSIQYYRANFGKPQMTICNSKSKFEWDNSKVEKGAPFDEEGTKGCPSGTCDSTRKSFTEYNDNE